MSIALESVWVLTVLLVSIRIGLFFFNTPFDMLGYMPARVKLLVVLVLSATLVTLLDVSIDSPPVSIVELVAMAAAELVVGLVMVTGLTGVFTALHVAGRLLDFQAGFGAASLFNSATRNQQPLIGTVLILLGVMWFYLAGAHHYVIKAIALSLQVISPGTGIDSLPIDGVVKIFSVMFAYGMLLAAPVLIVLYLIDTTVAVMARTMPQMNVYFLFLPVKILVALVMTGLMIRFVAPIMESLFMQLGNYWGTWLV